MVVSHSCDDIIHTNGFFFYTDLYSSASRDIRVGFDVTAIRLLSTDVLAALNIELTQNEKWLVPLEGGRMHTLARYFDFLLYFHAIENRQKYIPLLLPPFSANK